ncbi:MAG: hypothetical protein ACKOSR_05160 [Flavobacteriales bacterium]
MKLLSTLRTCALCIQLRYVQTAIGKKQLLFTALSLLVTMFLHAQQDGFQVVQGAEVATKKQTTELWSCDGYLFELKDDSKLEVYKKALATFGRLNEFRRADENNRIPINERDGYLIVLSWKELGVSAGKDGQFARRNLKFILNDNAQLKEQFLD